MTQPQPSFNRDSRQGKPPENKSLIDNESIQSRRENLLPPPYEYGYVLEVPRPQLMSRRPQQNVICPHCSSRCTATMIDRTFGPKTYIWSFIFCCLTGPICGLIPFFIDDLKRTRHFCPHCRNHIGSYENNRSNIDLYLSLLLILGVVFTILMSMLVFKLRCGDKNFNHYYYHYC